MNYDLTVKELLEIIQKKLDSLQGKNAVKEGGISYLVDCEMSKLEEISLSRYNIEVDQCKFKIYCSAMDNEYEFAHIRQKYRPDKRKWDGFGDFLESVTIELTREIPLDLEVLNVPQFLSFNIAKENFERLERTQKELSEEYKNNLKAMKKLQEVMKYQAYDKDSTKNSEEAEDILENLSRGFTID